MARPPSSGGLSQGPNPNGSRLRAGLTSAAQVLRLLSPLILVMLGLGLGVLSLTSDQTTLYSNLYAGSVAPGNATVDLPAVSPGFVQIAETTGGCDLRVYPATDAESVAFNATGTPPSSWIGCANRTVAISAPIRHLILLNLGSASLAYEISVQAYSIRTPLGWLSLPATALVLVGLITFLPRLMAGEVVKMREEFERRPEWRKEKK